METSTARRRPPSSRGDAREAALLEIAEALLRDGRFEAASIAEIAAAADLTRSAFYFYFASKQALLERLIERTLDDLLDRRLSALHASDASPAERVRALLHGVADVWVQHAVVLAAAADLAASVPAVFDRIAGVIASGVEPMARVLAHDDPGDARGIAEALLWMGERSFYVLARTDPAPGEYHALADRLATVWARTAGIEAPC